DGTSLLSWHHAQLERMVPGATYADATPWLQKIGNAWAYYELALSIYVAHGVLFEDYHGGESGTKLDSFTVQVFEPAWEAVRRRFGVSPLIVRLPWGPGFDCYPNNQAWRDHGIIPAELL
ncbi:MAG: hypothetical protein AAB912_03490, partial [Patescibacteria group bacterium]